MHVNVKVPECKVLQCRCRTFFIGAAKAPMKLVPIPCNYVADGLEANNLLLVKTGSKHRDVHSLISTEELDNPDAQYPRRTERRTRKVMHLRSICSVCSDGNFLSLLYLGSNLAFHPDYNPFVLPLLQSFAE